MCDKVCCSSKNIDSPYAPKKNVLYVQDNAIQCAEWGATTMELANENMDGDKLKPNEKYNKVVEYSLYT